MKRKAKQIFYGMIYLFVFLFVIYLIVKPSFKVEPSCFDNIKNQGEEGVDCGGPCEVPCYIKEALPLELVGTPLLFKDEENGKIFSFFMIQNKNSYVGSHGFYIVLKFFDENKNFVGETREKGSILPSESKNFLVEYEDSVYNVNRIKRVEVKLEDVVWAKNVEFPSPQLVLDKNFSLRREGENLVISGSITNESIFDLSKVRILILIFDKYGDPIFAGQTLKENLVSQGSYDFEIFLPFKFFRDVGLANLKGEAFLYFEE